MTAMALKKVTEVLEVDIELLIFLSGFKILRYQWKKKKIKYKKDVKKVTTELTIVSSTATNIDVDA